MPFFFRSDFMYQGDSDILSWLNAARCHDYYIRVVSLHNQNVTKFTFQLNVIFVTYKKIKYFYYHDLMYILLVIFTTLKKA